MDEMAAEKPLSPQEVLERYAVYAQIMGREIDSKQPKLPDGSPNYKMAGYSLQWFFGAPGEASLAAPENLNELGRAFQS